MSKLTAAFNVVRVVTLDVLAELAKADYAVLAVAFVAGLGSALLLWLIF